MGTESLTNACWCPRGPSGRGQLKVILRENSPSDLLRGGLGGPGLGLDVLEDCAPSAALLLLVGHDFLDSEALLATRGAHLPEAEHYMWAGGKWGCGLIG